MAKNNSNAIIGLNDALEASLLGSKSAKQLQPLLIAHESLVISTAICKRKNTGERSRLDTTDKAVLSNVASTLTDRFGVYPGVDYEKIVKDTICGVSDTYDMSEALLLELAVESICGQRTGNVQAIAETVDVSEGEAGAARVVKNTTHYMREYMLSLYQQRKALELRVLGRLIQISTCVLLNIPAEVTELVQKFVGKIVKESGWVEQLVAMATQYHNNALRVSESDIVPAGWEECAVAAATCLLFVATRESYSAQQALKDLDAGEDGDGSMRTQSVRSDTDFHYVLARENSGELTSLIKLMQGIDPTDIVAMATDDSGALPTANQISVIGPNNQLGPVSQASGRVPMATPRPVVEYYSDFSIVIMHAVYYGVYAYTSVHCNTDVRTITNLLSGTWKSLTLQRVYALFVATTMERGLVNGDTAQHDEYLAQALQHTTPATDRGHDSLSVHPTSMQLMGELQLIGGDGGDHDVGRGSVLRMLRTRVVTSKFIESSENRELFLRCHEEVMGCVYLMKKDEWLHRSQSINEMIMVREFVDLWGELYKDWPEGTLVLLKTEFLERLLAYCFDIPDEAQDFKLKAQHCLAVYTSFIGMLGSLCNSSECSAQLIAALKYRQDRLSWNRFKEYIDNYVRDLDPNSLMYANGGRVPAPAASMGTYNPSGNYGNYNPGGNYGNYDARWNRSPGSYAQPNRHSTFGSQRAFDDRHYGPPQHGMQDTHMYNSRGHGNTVNRADDKDDESDRDMQEIDPTDEKGLRLVLRLIRRACRYPDSDAVKHIVSDWEAVGQLFKLLTCRIPLTLRAAVMRTIAAFATTPAHAYELWSVLDEHDLRSVVLLDRQELESKDGVYPLTIAFLELLHVLLNATDHLKLTNTLGLPRRTPGLTVYLRFVIDVFVTAQDAPFVYESERWKIFKLCLGIFEVILGQYKISPTHFYDRFYSPDNAYTDDPLLPLATEQELQPQPQTRSAFADPDPSLYPDGSLSGDSSLLAPTHVVQSERTSRPPGMQLLTEFLAGDKRSLVKGVLSLLERGVSALTRAKNMAKRNAQCKKLHARAEVCIRSALRLIYAVLVSQTDFIHFAISAGSKNCLPTLVPLEKHVISADKHPVMGHTNSVKAIAQFVSYDCLEIASLSVRIMTLLSESLVSGPKLVPLVRDTQVKAESYVMGHESSIDSDRRDFMLGYVLRLTQRTPRVSNADTATTRHRNTYPRDNRLVHGNRSARARSHAAKKESQQQSPVHNILEEIVQLFIVNLTDVPFPNVAHYILGYDLNSPETTDLRRERSCLFHIHAMVQKGVHERSGRSQGNQKGLYETSEGSSYSRTNTYNGGNVHSYAHANGNGSRDQVMGRGEEGETLFQFNPKLSELCYRLIYLLCTQSKTSVATLNWLRTNGDDFFCSQLRHVRLSASDFINHTHQGMGINRFTIKAVAVPQTQQQRVPLRIADHMDHEDEFPNHVFGDARMASDAYETSECYNCGQSICTQNDRLFRSGATKFYVIDSRADHRALCIVCYCDISQSIDPSHQSVDNEVSLLTQHTWFVRTFTQELLYNIRHHPQSRQVGRLVQYLFQLIGVGETQGEDVHMLQQGGRVVLEMLESLSRIPVEYAEGQTALRRFFLTAMEVGNVFDPAHSTVSDRGAMVVDIESVLSEAVHAHGQSNVPGEQLDAWTAYLRLLLIQNCKVDLATVRDRALDAWQEMLGVALQGLALDQTNNAFVTLFDLLSGLLAKMDNYTLAEACGRSTVAVSDKLRSIQLQGLAQASAETQRHAYHVGQVPVYQMQEAMDAIVRVLVDKITSQSTRSCLYTTLLNLISFAKDSQSSRHSTHTSSYYSNEGPARDLDSILPSESLLHRLIPVVATDAMSGNGSCKSMGVALMSRLLKSDSGTWIESLSQNGFLDHFVGILKNDDGEVTRALHTHSGSLLPIYNYEAKMSFLVLVASVQEGAAALVASGVFRRLSTFTCLQESPLHTDETDQSFGSRADRERRVVLWALRLVGGILASVGRENVSAVAEALDFVAAKKELFLSVLKGGAHSSPTARLTPHVLGEIKLTVGIFYRLSADAHEFNRRLGASALVFHKHLLGCLVRFAVPSRWKSRMAYPVPNAVEPMEISSLDSRMRGVQSQQFIDPTVIAEVECDVRDICLSLVSYLRSVVKGGKLNQNSAQIMPLLSPSLQNAIVLANNESSAPSHITDDLANEENVSSKRPPSLSALVIYIRTAISSLLSRVSASAARARGRGAMGPNGAISNMSTKVGASGLDLNIGTNTDVSGNTDTIPKGASHRYTLGGHEDQGYGMPHTAQFAHGYHGYGLGSASGSIGTIGSVAGDLNEFRSAFMPRPRHQPSFSEDAHTIQILLCGIESALYVLMLHLHYYLTVAAVTTPQPYITTAHGAVVAGIDMDDGGMLTGGEIAWDQMTRQSREKLKSTASSCLAQVLDNLQFSADVQNQIYTLTGCSSEFMETVSQQIRSLLELERRGVSY